MRAERVVVDTNVLISAALLPNGAPRAAIDAVRRTGGSLVFSDQTIAELRTRLGRSKFDRYVTRADRALFLAQIEAVAEWVSITGAKLGCRDPDDDKVLETALMSAAECIITGDRDLLAMTPFRGIPVLEPRGFLVRLGAL